MKEEHPDWVMGFKLVENREEATISIDHSQYISANSMAAEIYRDLLTPRGNGYPLWEPDPRGQPPVELADGKESHFRAPLILRWTFSSGLRKIWELSKGVQCKIAFERSQKIP